MMFFLRLTGRPFHVVCFRASLNQCVTLVHYNGPAIHDDHFTDQGSDRETQVTILCDNPTRTSLEVWELEIESSRGLEGILCFSPPLLDEFLKPSTQNVLLAFEA